MNFSLTLCLTVCLALLVGFLAGYSVGFLASSFKLLDLTDWSDTQGEPSGQEQPAEHKTPIGNKVDNKEKVE